MKEIDEMKIRMGKGEELPVRDPRYWPPVSIPERPYGHAYVQGTVDGPSGLHELWLVVHDPDGTIRPIAGPEPWPEGWVSLKNSIKPL